MAKYLVLIYGDEKIWDSWTEQDTQANHERHVAFSEAAGDAIIGGNALQATTTATSLRGDAAGRPTGRSPRRRRPSAGTTCWRHRTSTLRSPWPG